MPTIIQYRPAFVEGFENEVVTFSTVEELLAIEFVHNFSTSPEFHQYAVSPHGNQWVLMATYRLGREWWVVGWLDENVPELPVWQGGVSSHA